MNEFIRELLKDSLRTPSDEVRIKKLNLSSYVILIGLIFIFYLIYWKGVSRLSSSYYPGYDTTKDRSLSSIK